MKGKRFIINKIDCGLTTLNTKFKKDTLVSVFCQNNKLKEIDVPETVVTLNCVNNQIKELKLPESVKYLYCDHDVKLIGFNPNEIERAVFVF